MTTLNASRFIEWSINSVVNQIDSSELIIVDGGSTDETLETAEKLSKKMGINASLFSNPGYSQASGLNFAEAKASGKFIAWLNADEAYLPGSLMALREQFEHNCDLKVSFGDWLQIDGTGKFERLVVGYPFKLKILKYRGCIIQTISMMISRDEFQKYGLTPLSRNLLDWDLFLNVIQKSSDVKYIRRPIGIYAKHENQISASLTSRRGSQHKAVRNLHNINNSSLLQICADWSHRFLKFFCGAYFLQLKARTLRGEEVFNSSGVIREDFLEKLYKIYSI
jgi:glycosyltransferase involved in cell wall biosynthesis